MNRVLPAVILICVWAQLAQAQRVQTEDELQRRGLTALSAAALSETFVGNTMRAVHPTRGKVDIYYDPNGERRGVVVSRGDKFKNPYQMTDDGLCITGRFVGAEGLCFRIYADEGFFHFCDPREAGVCSWRVEVETGNPLSL